MSEEPGPCPAGRHDDERLKTDPVRVGKTGNGLHFHRLTDDEFVEFYDRLAPHAARYLRSFVRSGRISDADAEDIFQDAWILLDQARKRKRKRIRDPRCYLFGILRRAVYSHLRKSARKPALLSELIPDPRAAAPDQLAAENEEFERTSRREAEAIAWRERFRRAIVRLKRTLRELKRLLRERPGEGTGVLRPAKRGPGAPTKALRFRSITEDTLPRTISWLLKYFLELEKGT